MVEVLVDCNGLWLAVSVCSAWRYRVVNVSVPGREGNGKEGKGKEWSGLSSVASR